MEKKYIIKLEENEIAYKTVNSNGCPMIGLLHPVPYIEPDMEQVRKETYEKGINDAWEAARKIWEYDTTTLREIFGDGIMRMDWFMKFTASKAIEKIRQYEQGKKEERDGLRQNIQTIVDKCGYTLDEIAEVLEKMREGQEQ